MDNTLVAPILWTHIKPLKARLNIVENPSVGLLRASTAVCELIDFALQVMLEVELIRNPSWVRVRCSVDERRILTLAVVDDGPWPNVPQQFRLSDIGIRAGALGGDVGVSNFPNALEMTMTMLVPISSS